MIAMILALVSLAFADSSPPKMQTQTSVKIQKFVLASPEIAASFGEIQNAIVARNEAKLDGKESLTNYKIKIETPNNINFLSKETVFQAKEKPPRLRRIGYDGNLSNHIRADTRNQTLQRI